MKFPRIFNQTLIHRMERLAMEAMQREDQSFNDSSDVDRPKSTTKTLKKATSSKNTSFNSSLEKEDKKSKKKQKLYCVCQTPYDKSK
jgi:hypothetical protein